MLNSDWHVQVEKQLALTQSKHVTCRLLVPLLNFRFKGEMIFAKKELKKIGVSDKNYVC